MAPLFEGAAPRATGVQLEHPADQLHQVVAASSVNSNMNVPLCVSYIGANGDSAGVGAALLSTSWTVNVAGFIAFAETRLLVKASLIEHEMQRHL